MKTLLVLRHGKAENIDPAGLGDFYRPLAPEGAAKIKRAGERFAALWQAPVLVVASAALRTKQTAEIFCDAASLLEVRFDDHLYHANAEDWLATIKGTEAHFNSLVLIGHNPALSELVSLISKTEIQLETGGAVLFRTKLESTWDLATAWYHVEL